MRQYIVRIERDTWYRNDYVGTYSASSAVDALRQAGRDSYLQCVSDRHDDRLVAEAV